VNHLDVIETDYFGLTFRDKSGKKVFISTEKQNDSDKPLKFRFFIRDNWKYESLPRKKLSITTAQT